MKLSKLTYSYNSTNRLCRKINKPYIGEAARWRASLVDSLSITFTLTGGRINAGGPDGGRCTGGCSTAERATCCGEAREIGLWAEGGGRAAWGSGALAELAAGEYPSLQGSGMPSSSTAAGNSEQVGCMCTHSDTLLRLLPEGRSHG